MPTYEYECTDPTCQHTWEEEQSIKADPLKKCPKCSLDTAKRLVSSSSFILQGEGWFKDGY